MSRRCCVIILQSELMHGKLSITLGLTIWINHSLLLSLLSMMFVFTSNRDYRTDCIGSIENGDGWLKRIFVGRL